MHLPGKRQKAAVNGLADMFLRAYAAQCFQYPIARMPRRSAFWPKPQKAPKTLLFPGTKRKIPAVFFDGAELAGGVVWFSSCRQGVGKPLFTLTSMAGVRLLVRAGNYR